MISQIISAVTYMPCSGEVMEVQRIYHYQLQQTNKQKRYNVIDKNMCLQFQ